MHKHNIWGYILVKIISTVACVHNLVLTRAIIISYTSTDLLNAKMLIVCNIGIGLLISKTQLLCKSYSF